MSVRLRLSIWTSILLATLTISALSQERAPRVALVIGNAGYPDASTPLPTTINDARTLAGELRRFDFDVEVKEDVGRADMQRAIDAFVGKIGTGATALFYFGGFGLQVARENYLIPVDAEIWSEGDVAVTTTSATGVLVLASTTLPISTDVLIWASAALAGSSPRSNPHPRSPRWVLEYADFKVPPPLEAWPLPRAP